MNISRDNYESWFLDYLEGKLDAGQVQILMNFLEFNPDLRRELEGLEITRLEPREYVYEQKAGLRKPVSNLHLQTILENFDDFCISGIEQQLSPEEESMLQGIIKDYPEKQRIYQLYRSTLLEADERIKYPCKPKLKKRYIDVPRVRMSIYSVAAVAVLMLALSSLFRNVADRNAADRNVITETTDVPSITGEAEPAKTVTGEKTGEILAGGDRSTGTPGPGETGVNTDRSSEEVKPAGPSVSGVNTLAGDFSIKDEPAFPEPILISRLEPIGAEQLSNPGRGQEHTMDYHLRGTEFDDYLSLQEYAMLQLSKRIYGDPAEKKFSFWKLANAGIQRINKYSEEDYSLERKTDENGKTRWLTFETPLFGISTPMRNLNITR